ncbi:Vgb family protein [Sorangium sp. So ce1000]|uniref:Vgb family protein n=1 Tax=Sorangium sp. So ce1000 TaxID=3133325 RepID=UPI003F61DC5F
MNNMDDMSHMSSMSNTPGTSTGVSTLGRITEYDLDWKSTKKGSTHELVTTRDFIFVTGQDMDKVAKLDYTGKVLAHWNMPKGSGPHGLLVDAQDRLWVSLEMAGKVVRLDDEGCIAEEVDVRIQAHGAPVPINPAPHGICLGADKCTIWFTGKRTSTIGKINPDRTVQHFELPQLGGVPIFLNAGPDGNVWGTELNTSMILNVSPQGTVKEHKIPTTNSRPIAIIPDPTGDFMWFTEEAGRKVGRVDATGNIVEYPVPALQPNHILGSLSFDSETNLWVQVYVDSKSPVPAGPDYLVSFEKSIRQVIGTQLSGVPYSTHVAPSRGVMFHRIRMGGDGNLWFTEMMTDRIGKVTL